MKNYSISDIIGMAVAHELKISTHILQIIESRLETQEHRDKLYGFVYNPEYFTTEDAKAVMFSLMTDAEKNALQFLNGEVPRLWIYKLDEDAENDQGYYRNVDDIHINPTKNTFD